MTLTKDLRQEINSRSGGACEAMVLTGLVWNRCWHSPTEIHHLLTRARGGHILDYVGETYHLISLCGPHHRASDGGDAYMGRLLISGYVAWDKRKQCPVYTGPDEYLQERYGVKK